MTKQELAAQMANFLAKGGAVRTLGTGVRKDGDSHENERKAEKRAEMAMEDTYWGSCD